MFLRQGDRLVVLTDGSIRAAIETCSAIPSYYIGIAFRDWESCVSHLTGDVGFEITINDELTLCGYPFRVSNHNSVSVSFPNGSRLLMFIARESLHERGHKFDKIIYEEGISVGLIQQVLRPMELPARIGYNPTLGVPWSVVGSQGGETMIDVDTGEDLWSRTPPIFPTNRDIRYEFLGQGIGTEGFLKADFNTSYQGISYFRDTFAPKQNFEFEFDKEELDEFLGDALKE